MTIIGEKAGVSVKAHDNLVIGTEENILLGGSKDSKGTTTPSSMSSFERGGKEDVHRKLGNQKETPPLYIPIEMAEAGPRNN